jgi:diguanylate cyclase
MRFRLKVALYGCAIAVFSLAAYVFQYESDIHILIVQAHYIFMFVVAILDRKSLLPVVSALIVTHLFVDTVRHGSLPWQVVTESAVQAITAYVLHRLVSDKDKQTVRYENVIDAGNIGTWEWNVSNDRYVYNARWAEIVGTTLATLRPLSKDTWRRFVHPDDIAKSDEAFRRLLVGLEPDYDVKLRMRHTDGRWIWVQDRGKVIRRSVDGKPLIVAGTHTDITEEMALREKLSHSHSLLTYIIDHANAAIAVHDRDLNYIFASRKYYEDYGIKDPDIIGKHHYDVFPDLPQAWRDVHQRVLKGAIERADRDPFPREDGHIDMTRWESRPWYENDGSIGGIIVYTEIINDLIENEHALERSRNLLQDVMDSLPIGIAVLKSGSGLVFDYMNDNFPRIYGTTREALEIHGNFFDAVYEDPVFRATMRERVMSDIASQDPARMEWTDIPITDKHKPTRYISAFATPIGTSGLLISTVIDVTERKLREDDIRRLAYTDAMTGLSNRLSFDERMKACGTGRDAVLMIDINGLKLVNDAFGTDKGNDAIRMVASTLQNVCGPSDTVYRTGGDEFAIVISEADDERVEKLASGILSASTGLKIGDVGLSIAVGRSSVPVAAGPLSDLVKEAEEDMYKRKVFEGQSVRNRSIMGILSMLSDKYDEERVHSERVSDLCKTLGMRLGITGGDLEELRMAGLLHDIGKIAIPDKILDKPGKLDDEEWRIMRKHTLYGYNILKAADEYSNLALYALTHHERYDGKGYPQGLAGENIPLYARIISVADAFEAMTADRVYRARLSADMVIKEINRCSGTQFDPVVVRSLLSIIEEDPGIMNTLS